MAGQKVRCPSETCATVIRVPQPVEFGIPDAIVVADPPAKPPAKRGIPDAIVVAAPPATPKEKTRPSAPRPAAKSAPPRRPPPPPVDDEDDDFERVEAPRRKPPQEVVEEEDPLEGLDDESPLERPRKKKRRQRKKRRGGDDSAALRYARKQGAGILFALAVINLICGGISVAAASAAGSFLPGLVDTTSLVIAVIVIVVTYAGLGVWACFRPLIPVLIGILILTGDTLYTLFTTEHFSMFLITFMGLRALLISSLAKALMNAWYARSD